MKDVHARLSFHKVTTRVRFGCRSLVVKVGVSRPTRRFFLIFLISVGQKSINNALKIVSKKARLIQISFCKILKKNIVRRKRSSFIYCVGTTGFLSRIQMLE